MNRMYEVVKMIWGRELEIRPTGRVYETYLAAQEDCGESMSAPEFLDSLVTFEVREVREYSAFLEWTKQRGFEFPCTRDQFYARAVSFADGDQDLVSRLCEQGIGPDWQE